MSIKITNDTANGSVTLKGQNVAGDRTITMPNIDCELAPRMQLRTAQNSTSGTSIDFTGIPSWAKKITVMFNGVSTSGASFPVLQLGSSTFTVSGYMSAFSDINGSNLCGVSALFTTGFNFCGRAFAGAALSVIGSLQLVNISSNNWVATGIVTSSTTSYQGTGSVSLSGVLDRIRLTTVNGTDTFDAGQINVLYEG